MSDNSPEREISILRRAPVLDACRGGPKSRRELETATDCSRTTIYRATVELTEQGLLEKRPNGYQTTAKGEALSHLTEQFRSGVETVDHLEPLFEYVSHPRLLANAHRLSDAELTVADDGHIYRANDRVLELWRQADRIRMCAVAPGTRICLGGAVEATVQNGADVEMCFLPDARPDPDELASKAFDPAEMFEYCDTYVSDTIPFTFVLYDEVSVITGHNDISVPAVAAESDDPEVYRWLERIYDECKAGARPADEMLA
jgi:predicted transcriptional regulator